MMRFGGPLGFAIAMAIARTALAQNGVSPSATVVARPSKPFVRGARPAPPVPLPTVTATPRPIPAPVPAPIPVAPIPAPIPAVAIPAPIPAPILTPGTVARPSRPRFLQKPAPMVPRPAARPRRPRPVEPQDGPVIVERIDPFAEPEEQPTSGPFRFAASFGGSSLLVDPDMEFGMGGGLELGAWLSRRVGLELSVFASENPYRQDLGDTGIAFWAVNTTLGPTFRLTSPGSDWLVSLDAVFGGYLVIHPLQESTWTTGVGGGITFGKQLTRWLSMGVRFRYHVFNMSRVSGPEIIDIKALRPVAMVDRLEIPAYVAVHF
jgi:hypothetical protein